MHFNKPATTVLAQLERLQGRGLVCAEPQEAARQMHAIGYYRLSAYWLPFEVSPAEGLTRSKAFRPGVTWENILQIYVFDRKLRLLVMEAIERIEVSVRSSWSNRLTLAYGAHAQLTSDLFNDPWKHAAMLARMAVEVQRSEEVFIKHYRRKYLSPYMPPLWAVCETMTLGQLSMWFALTKDLTIRKAVAKDVGLPTHDVLEGVLQVLSLNRNICAHHGRLWNRRFVKRLPIIKRLGSEIVVEPINAGDGAQVQPQNLIYNTLVVMLHMLRLQSGDTSLPLRLSALIDTVTDEQRRAMGFPTDWHTRATWRAA